MVGNNGHFALHQPTLCLCAGEFISGSALFVASTELKLVQWRCG